MKRVITSSLKSIKSASQFGVQYTLNNWHNKSGHNYFVRVRNEDDPLRLQLQISGLHPYDDAEYAWARVESFRPNLAQIIKNGKFLSSVEMEEYEEGDWETPESYIDAFVDRIIEELEEANKDVEPQIIKF